ncbi:tetratricopeptide repeat protein [Actinomycetes bacterium KLBMP 9797]
MEFRLLGAVGIWKAGHRLGPTTAQQRTVLALLLLDAGSVVSVERFVTALWDTPPARARNAVQVCASRIRRVLALAGLSPTDAELLTSQRGYRLAVDVSTVDLHQFRHAARTAGQRPPAQAHALLRTGLALWRGAPLADVAGSWLAGNVIPGLEGERLAAVEHRVALDLVLGHHHEIAAELSTMSAEFPLRERLAGLQLVALHRCGRRVDALATFRQLRKRFVDELGIEPSGELHRMHQAILDGREPSFDLAVTGGPLTVAAPRPQSTASETAATPLPLVGRERELSQLDALRTASERLVLITGNGGVGKTSLAVRWARGNTSRFPDGQHLVDMRGFHPGSRMTPAEALPLLLISLGVAAEKIPIGIDAQIALYQSRLAGRKALIILDNVAQADQVRPLLSTDPGCLTLVTSRDRLSGLVAVDGARRLAVDTLPPAAAVDVLAQVAGVERIGADQAAAARLAQLCGHLPLALRIAGARLADRPDLGVRRYVDQLAALGPIAQLRVDGDETASVRNTFDLSYQALTSPTQRLFRLLGLVPAPGGLAITAAAALAGVPVEAVEPMIDQLARYHLVEVADNTRLACHDLLLQYAADRTAEQDPPAEQDAATDRLLHFYLHNTDRAAALLHGRSSLKLSRDPHPDGVPIAEFAGEAHAQRWLRDEWANIVAGLDFAAATGRHRMAWHLADAVRDFMQLQAPPQYRSIVVTGLHAARQAGDLQGEAAMRHSLGVLCWRVAEFHTMIDECQAAADLAARARWPQGQSAALCNSGIALAQLGQTQQAIQRFTQSLAIDREIGDRAGEAALLINLAAAHEQLGDLPAAARFGADALRPLRETGQRQGEAIAMNYLATVRREQGHLDEALDTITASLAICRSVGARHDEAAGLTTLGLVHRDAGRYNAAFEALTAACEIAQRLPDRRLTIFALVGLGNVQVRRGHLADAEARLDTATDLAHHIEHDRAIVEALLATSELHLAKQRPDRAHDHATRALDIAQRSGYTLLTAQAHNHLATASLDLRDPAGCLKHCEQALPTQQRAGQRLAQARTLLLRARAHQSQGDVDLARSHREQARRVVAQIQPSPAATSHA